MSAVLAIGLGCRRAAAASDVAAAIARVRERAGPERPIRLFTLDIKAGEPGLQEAATNLGADLVGLPAAALAVAAPGVATVSPAARRRFGLPSISEAAALAGAGPGARLLVARCVVGGATAAAALSEEGA